MHAAGTQTHTNACPDTLKRRFYPAGTRSLSHACSLVLSLSLSLSLALALMHTLARVHAQVVSWLLADRVAAPVEYHDRPHRNAMSQYH